MSKFDKQIPIPVRKKYEFLSEMEIGDSVFVEMDKRKINSYGSSVTYCGINQHKKFVRRTCTEDGKFGLRIWRIS